MDKRLDLYLGASRIGSISQIDSDFPNLWGKITYDPTFGSGQTARVAQFVALNRERTRLADMESETDTSREQEVVSAELETHYLDYVESEDWHVIDEQRHKLPILCPIFRGESEIVWRWNPDGR